MLRQLTKSQQLLKDWSDSTNPNLMRDYVLQQQGDFYETEGVVIENLLGKKN
jgi:hypothetical protein